MDFSKSTRRQLPEGGTLKTAFSPDGDIIPVSVSYPTVDGGQKEVAMKWTSDGDLIPETGYTMDGDFNFPNKKITF